MGLFTNKDKEYKLELSADEVGLVGVAVSIYLGRGIESNKISPDVLHILAGIIKKINVPLLDMALKDQHATYSIDYDELTKAYASIKNRIK